MTEKPIPLSAILTAIGSAKLRGHDIKAFCIDGVWHEVYQKGNNPMKIKTWHPEMTDKESKDLAYWERNMLALKYADGWYNDDIEKSIFEYPDGTVIEVSPPQTFSRYQGWRRVLSLENGAITFHVPDDFDVGNLQQIQRNWDGHTTEEKWQRIAASRGIQ